MMVVLEAGADYLKAETDSFEITAAPEDFNAVAQALEDNKIETVQSEITMLPDTTVKLEGKDADKMLSLIDALEEHDDVQNVYSNYEIDEEE
jgi:transcriptional/translational regulatory protein YebC/TACO1